MPITELKDIIEEHKALKAQAEREKGCEYCNDISFSNVMGRDFYKDMNLKREKTGVINTDMVCLAHDKNGFWLTIQGQGHSFTDIPKTTCPNCGRKLGGDERG